MNRHGSEADSLGRRSASCQAEGSADILTRTVLVGVAALVGVLALGCSQTPASALPSLPSREKTLSVRRGDYREVLQLTGEIESAGGVTIVVPRIPNWQTTIKTIVEDGTRVGKEQVLAELDSTAFSNGLQQKRQSAADAEQSKAQQTARSRADLEQKEFEVERTRIELDKARSKAAIPAEILPLRDFEDNQLALKRAENAWDKAKTDLASQKKAAVAELENFQIQISKTQYEIATAEAAIDSLTLRAPSPGVVIVLDNQETGRKFQVGDSVFVGNRLMSIPDLGALRVKARLIDVDDGLLQQGMKVELVPDAYPETRLRGTVTQVTRVAGPFSPDSLRRGFEVIIALDDAGHERLRPGFSVRATVVCRETKGTLLVPRIAIDFTSAQPRARLSGGRLVDVRLGGCNSSECVVLGGLAEGQRLAPARPAGGERS